jgi:hypothetical protein
MKYAQKTRVRMVHFILFQESYLLVEKRDCLMAASFQITGNITVFLARAA